MTVTPGQPLQPPGMFHKDMGMRIDHVYADAVLAAQVRDAYIDREARKGQGPSDHAPVVVDVTAPDHGWSGQGSIPH